MNSERPRFADGIVRTIGDGALSQPEIFSSNYIRQRDIIESQLRKLLAKLVKAGILIEIRHSEKKVDFKVSEEEKKRCLNLARKANKGCKEWMKGLPESWNGQFRSQRSISQSLKG